MENIRVLVVSNSCFSMNDSNGRTLAKYFSSCFLKSNIAQIYIHGVSDKTVCANYYQISDKDALRSFIQRREYGHIVETTGMQQQASSNPSAKKMKTPFKLLLREMVWKYGKWSGPSLKKWIADFHPTHIFLFLADNAFLIDFANKLAVELRIPIIAYTTEDYYFKDYNYVTKRRSLAYLLLHRKVQHAYRRCESGISTGIFNTPLLTMKFASEFAFPCKCLFAQSDIDFIPNAELPKDGCLKVSYLGNLGLNRHEALMEIANTLHDLVPGTKLHVYGKVPEAVEDEFLANKNIKYEGFVNYERVVSVLHESNLLVHAEYDDDYNRKDLKFAFSTKIADSVCSGTPLLMYGNELLTETDFLINHQCAFVASHADELKEVLKSALLDVNIRTEIVHKAKQVREQYFSANGGSTIREIIENAI